MDTSYKIAVVKSPQVKQALSKVESSIVGDDNPVNDRSQVVLSELLHNFFNHSDDSLDDDILEAFICMYDVDDELISIADHLHPLFCFEWDKLLKVELPDKLGNLKLYFLR